MTYENLQIQNTDVFIKEIDLSGINGLKGMYFDGNIAIHQHMTQTEKSCVLAEELGHHHTTIGNILDQTNAWNRKQEQQARTWAYNKLVGLMGIINAYKAGCRNAYEMAEYLDVTEEFLNDALERYRRKYGEYATVDNYTIYFEPYLAVLEIRHRTIPFYGWAR